MKNSLDGFNNRIDMAEESINLNIEIILSEQ